MRYFLAPITALSMPILQHNCSTRNNQPKKTNYGRRVFFWGTFIFVLVFYEMSKITVLHLKKNLFLGK